MNDSTSTTSPVWPTHWPPNSFRAGPTLLVLAAIIALALLAIVAGVAWVAYCCRAAALARDVRALLLPSLVAQLFSDLLVAAVVITQLPRLSGFSAREIGIAVPQARHVGTAALGAVAMLVLVQGSAEIVQRLTNSNHEQEAVALFRSLHDPKQIAVFVLFAAIVAPIGEESFFRLFTFNACLRYLGGFWPAAIVSGILFAALHLDAYAFVPLALGGIVLAGVYYRTGNAFASMITHGLFNGVPLLLIAFFPNVR